jgi:hypothetical protein
MRDSNDELRNQSIFKIDEEDEERKVSYNDIVLDKKIDQISEEDSDSLGDHDNDRDELE